jgi:hypothetical protein
LRYGNRRLTDGYLVSSVAVTDLIPLLVLLNPIVTSRTPDNQTFSKQRGLYQGMANMYVTLLQLASISVEGSRSLFGLGAGLGGPLGGWMNDAFGW